MFKIANALGVDDSHIAKVEYTATAQVSVHRELAPHLLVFKKAAANAGFDLGIASGFRSFERQRCIWNDKVLGKRPVLSPQEVPLNVSDLSSSKLLEAVMHWSAVPGGSRHHWGTDIDIFDASALKGDTLKLTQNEAKTLFAPFYAWLDTYLAANPDWQRPYSGQGPIAAEPWHLSYAPLACRYQKLINAERLLEQLKCSGVLFVDELESDWAVFYRRYISAYFVASH